MRRLVLADVGNSRTKLAHAPELGKVEFILRDANDFAAWPARLAEVVGPPPYEWAVAGVRPARVRQLCDWIAARAESCTPVNDYRRVPIELTVARPEQVGIDRLLDAVAANARRRPGTAAITLDAGTALVCNVIDPAGRFLGGGIAPGLTTLFASLAAATASLPDLSAAPPHEFRWPGTTTEEAISAGCLAAFVGAAVRFVEHTEALFGSPPGTGYDLFLTGGDAQTVASAFASHPNRPVHVVPTLTLEGLNLVVRTP